VRHPTLRIVVAAVVAASVAVGAVPPREMYERAMVREAAVRRKLEQPRPSAAVLMEARRVAQSYESLALSHPTSGYSDNAFWQAAGLTSAVYALSDAEPDRLRAIRLYKAVTKNYPASSLVAKADAEVARLEGAAGAPSPARPVPVDTLAAAPAREVPAAPRTSTPAPVPAPVAPPPSLSRPLEAPPATARRDEPTTRPATEAEERILKVPDASRMTARDIAAFAPPDAAPAPSAADAQSEAGLVRAISRSRVGEIERVVIELDREIAFHDERIGGPDRVFVDVRGVRVTREARRTQKFSDGFVRQIRVGERPDRTTRIVLDLDETTSHSVFTLYNPFRVVIDCERRSAVAPIASSTLGAQAAAAPRGPRSRDVAGSMPPPVAAAPPAAVLADTTGDEPPLATAAPVAPPSLPPAPPEEPVLPGRRSAATPAATSPPLPTAPSANIAGRFSLSRQLGLGIARIVIDPGHGGHDPGARVKGLNEAELVLDVALRLEQLLLKQQGIEVVLTRRTDIFIPLEERTALANREGADLFLSIHANASRNPRARGVETYFLNFASNPDAEAVAARENAASGRTMHSLPDIVKAITLNNKLDESRDFASIVQKSMVRRLGTSNKALRDLGVKQAPFVVLIGAAMPSVLAEISFVTHPQEGRLLKGGAYRQKIAESLFDGIAQYQRSLKSVRTVATQ
jgi:N-acetylmuramoyl-L-alanine amidase